MERTETVIIGAGQAGLATSYELSRLGREHVVLEQASQVANAWRTGRWDSFTLVTPNWSVRMPGAPYDGPDRDGFMPRDEVVAYFERYVERFQLPVRVKAGVDAVEPDDAGGYRVRTAAGSIAATNVVIATGLEQLPRVPALASGLPPEVTQLHSSTYRNPVALPAGGVLVVGTAQSGCQIAEELYQAGRTVHLCTGSAGRAPRRYRGKDVVAWLDTIGFFDMTPDKLPFPKERFAAPHVSGARGGHSLNLHQFARDGVTLLGHLAGAEDHTLRLDPDLHQNLARADGFERQVQAMIDDYIQANGLDAPAEELPQLRDGFAQPVIEELDLHAAGITTVIWATGYRFDFSLVTLPVFEHDGFPRQQSGVTAYPGLSFVGMPWMPSLKMGTLMGAGESAARIVARLTSQAGVRASGIGETLAVEPRPARAAAGA